MTAAKLAAKLDEADRIVKWEGRNETGHICTWDGKFTAALIRVAMAAKALGPRAGVFAVYTDVEECYDDAMRALDRVLENDK